MNRIAKQMMICVAGLAMWTATANHADAQETAPSAMGQFAEKLNPMNWQMPSFKQLLPGQEEKARITKKKDSLFSEVGKTASSSWQRTKEAFSPKKLNPVNFFQASSRTNVKEEKKPGFFSSLFNPQMEDADETETVSDFLSQTRPQR